MCSRFNNHHESAGLLTFPTVGLFVRYQTVVGVLVVVDLTIDWHQTGDGGTQDLRREYFSVDFDLTTSFSCPQRIFEVLKDTIERTVNEVSELFTRDSERLSLVIKKFETGESSRAVFYIKGTNVAVLARTKDALDNILTGL